jgi:preprotein translocase subunit YajC
MIIPDYIMPLVGYRVWRWNDATGLKSLNGEPWLPGRPLAAGCRVAAHELPHSDCTCGVYAARNLEHLRQFGYEQRGIHGEVYLWGTVVEHKLGWRAQFAYPKSLFLPPNAFPFKLSEIDARLKTLIAFGADIFLLGDHESIRFWNNDSGFDAAGLDYLIKTRKEYYVRRQRESTLKNGDRVAVLGQGIGVVEQIEGKQALVVLGKRLELRIARKDIVLNQQYSRWECEANNVRENNSSRELSLI